MKKDNFIWGVATAAYQVEGAWLEGGKGLSIWDAYSHTPGKIQNGDTGDIACDHYHRLEEDVTLMAKLGVDAYRFSIAWSRIIPDGSGKPNQEGIDFYNRLIDTLLKHDIQPFITLYHWDLPLALQMEHNGWLNYSTSEAFSRYAKVCFESFGDRVRHWITFNESWCTAVLGYGTGLFAPGRISKDEPYIAAHNLLLAHGLAVREFRNGGFDGSIGVANNCDWREPLTDSQEDRDAAQVVHLSSDPEWEKTSMGWFVVPWGFRKMLQWIDKRYRKLPIYVTENGCAVEITGDRSPTSDPERCQLITSYTEAIEESIADDHVNVRGYFHWSLMDRRRIRP